ncbi:MAG: endonuclease domain-containing protein [Sphingomicrobium sp.]
MSEPQRRPTRRAQQLRNEATPAERLLWKHLSRRELQGFKFSRQIPVGPFICDFLCPERMLVVELDGGQHSERTSQDAERTVYLQQQGLTVIRFWNNDVVENIEGVLLAILGQLENLTSRFKSPLPLAGGEEPRSGEGVGLIDKSHAHPQPPPASGRGLK